MVEVKKKKREDGSFSEPNEAMMCRFQRKAIVVFKSVKARGKQKLNRGARRKKAALTRKAREKYALGVKTGKIKVQPAYQSRKKEK